MKQNSYQKCGFKKVVLKKGEVRIFDFGKTKIHAYQTNDPISDEVFIAEKNGKALVIEPPCFFDNIKELEEYAASLNVETEGVLAPYHFASSASFMRGVKRFSTRKAEIYAKGHALELSQNFSKTFKESFDGEPCAVSEYIEHGKNIIGGFHLNILETGESFDIEFSEIKCLYTHMLGGTSHSIVAGEKDALAQIKKFERFAAKKYDLILSSHYVPESPLALKEKIAYLKDLLETARSVSSKEEFKSALKRKYPGYSGENYADMSADFFFQK